jgi:hypothetical protein
LLLTVMYDAAYKLWRSSLCNSPPPTVILSLVGLDMVLSFFNTF